MSSEDAAETAESSVQPQAARDVWDGSTVLLPVTAAECRVPPM